MDLKSCPYWDSAKRIEWATFSANFESFAMLIDADALVSIAQDFINPTSQDRPASSSFTTEGAEGEQSGDNDLATPEERYKALTPELKIGRAHV